MPPPHTHIFSSNILFGVFAFRERRRWEAAAARYFRIFRDLQVAAELCLTSRSDFSVFLPGRTRELFG
jgi:hypothetical protein